MAKKKKQKDKSILDADLDEMVDEMEGGESSTEKKESKKKSSKSKSKKKRNKKGSGKKRSNKGAAPKSKSKKSKTKPSGGRDQRSLMLSSNTHKKVSYLAQFRDMQMKELIEELVDSYIEEKVQDKNLKELLKNYE